MKKKIVAKVVPSTKKKVSAKKAVAAKGCKKSAC